MATARSGRYMPYLGDKFANSNLILTPLSGANPDQKVYKQEKRGLSLKRPPACALPMHYLCTAYPIKALQVRPALLARRALLVRQA